MRTLLIYLLICSLSGCGTRKRLVHVEAIQKDIRLKENKNVTTHFSSSEMEVVITYTPIDPDKPMHLPDGRTATNTKIEEKKSNLDKTEDIIDLSNLDWLYRFGTSKKDTNVESKKSNPYLWIYITIGTVVALFLFYRYVVKR